MRIVEAIDAFLGIDRRPYRGDVQHADVGSARLDKLLLDGYEPFAVDDSSVFLRKLVPVE